jgi:hypothetical protein
MRLERPRPESNQRILFRREVLYPLSYEGGRWRKRGAKLRASIAMAERSGDSGCDWPGYR